LDSRWLVLGRAAAPLDERPPEVLFSSKRIVCPAAQGQIGESVPAAATKRYEMVNLKAVCLAAGLPQTIDITAAPAITLENRAARGRRDVSTALSGQFKLLGGCERIEIWCLLESWCLLGGRG